MHLAFVSLFLLATAAPAAPSLDEARTTVETIRGLEFRRDVQREMRTRAQLREMLLDELDGEQGGAELYHQILEAALLVEPDEGLIDRMLDAYEQQVLAWYDPETGHFYELSDPASEVAAIPLMKEGVLVHELTHALQDQWFSIGERLDAIEHDWDRAQAYHAVLEGEASLVMLEAGLRSMGTSLEALRESGMSAESVIETMRATAAGTFPADVDPWFIETMKFPYIEGLRFVLMEWSRGGWDAVQKIHENPPLTTEEIFRPELWRSRIDAKSAVPAAITAEEGETTVISMGELAWRHLLGEQAAAGIDRATLSMTPRNGGWSVAVESTWDSENDAREFGSAYSALFASRGIKAEVSRDGNRVTAQYRWKDAQDDSEQKQRPVR